jgi:SAM-dependent methyltransferase
MAWLRYDLVERLLPPGVRTVLEVGCGQGAVGARLAQRYDYLGLEPDSTSFAVAQARLAAIGRGEVRQATVSSLPPDARFDLVCAFEVIEHIEDDAAALREWTAHVADGGWLMLSTPAHQSRYGVMDEAVGHFRRYEPDEFAALLSGAGLTDVDVRLYGVPLGFVLETGRELIGRRLRKRGGETSMEERSGGSGRLLQPQRPAIGAAIRLGTAPFRRIQRAFPRRGTGIVAVARKP